MKRDPDINKEVKKGKKVRFYLTETGKRKAMVEGVLAATELEMRDILKEFLDEAIEHGKRGALNSATGIVKSKSLPILGFLCLLSRKQYCELAKKLELEEPRKEISGLLPKFIDFYASDPDQFYAEYLPQKESVFLFGNLPREVSQQMKRAVDAGLWENHVELLNNLVMANMLKMWGEIERNLQNPEFLEGKKVVVLPIGCRYNPVKKLMEPIPEEKLLKSLRAHFNQK